jgi:hypothetical protein
MSRERRLPGERPRGSRAALALPVCAGPGLPVAAHEAVSAERMRGPMNRMSEPADHALTLLDERRALDARLERAKLGLRKDLTQLFSTFRETTKVARREVAAIGFRTIAAVGALVLLGVVTALVARRQRRRIVIRWR